jgi:hypothetical protein
MTTSSHAVEAKPSVPVIVYLYADRFVTKHPVLIEGTSIPCSKVRVQRGELVVRLLSSAFWSLRQQGLIHMELVESRSPRRIFRRPEVRLVTLKRVERPGLEGALIANLEDEDTAHEVICRWSELGSTDPRHDVIAEVVKEAVAMGLIREVEGAGGVLTRLLGDRVGLEPDCDRIAAFQNRFQELASSWREFQGREKPLHDGLTGQCKRSLAACTERWYA